MSSPRQPAYSLLARDLFPWPCSSASTPGTSGGRSSIQAVQTRWKSMFLIARSTNLDSRLLTHSRSTKAPRFASSSSEASQILPSHRQLVT